MLRRVALGCLIVLGLANALPAARAQELRTVYRNVSNEMLESVLKEVKIQYKKVNGNKEGETIYEFTRNTFLVRLHNYGGTDLWIEALFVNRLTLEDANRWNGRARHTRCVLLRSNDKETVSLESQFDCRGGSTEAIIRQFIDRFDLEVPQFAEFMKKTQPR